MILYKLSRGQKDWLIAKFDADFNVEAIYEVGYLTCNCPAGQRPTCRHRQMLPTMLPKADTDDFYCFDDGQWYQPLGAPTDFEEPPAGVNVLKLDDPAELHKHIADALGEPMVPEQPAQVPEVVQPLVQTAPPPLEPIRRRI